MKMSFHWSLIICFLLYCNQESAPAKAKRKFVYQKDMSEYCRRRVVPSIFLGRHVVEANSQILHFSRMELPYSCFISVRTESGSSIIFFIQLVSEDSLRSACSESGNQLLVYEMGETFGGYWGPLPESLVQRKHEELLKYYTLKTTQPTTITKYTSEEESDDNVSEVTDIVSEPSTKSVQSKVTGDYVVMDIPIVNVSGQLIPGKEQPRDFDIDETFDLIYDVAPRRGEQYKTTIVPLVQFSIKEQETPRRSGDTVPRYQLDYDLDNFTPDPRLTYPIIQQLTTTKRRKYKYRYNSNRRLTYKKNSRLFAPRKPPLYLKRFKMSSTLETQQTTSWYDIYFNTNNSLKSDVEQNHKLTIDPTNIEYNETLAYINNLMKTLKGNTKLGDLGKPQWSLNASGLINNLPSISINFTPEYNYYYDSTGEKPKALAGFTLSPIENGSTIGKSKDFDKKNDVSTEELSEHSGTENIMLRVQFEHNDELTNTSIILKNFNNESNRNAQELKEEPNSNSTDGFETNTNIQIIKEDYNILETTRLENVTNILVIKDDKDNTTVKSTSTVDHESWENVVQAASDMAVILNHTYDDNSSTSTNNMKQNMTKQGHNIARKKRFIHSLPIEDARPHNLTTRKDIPTTTIVNYKVSDLQDFVQLAELQDDEMHGHVALRYLRHYVGPLMFNICDFNESKDRQVMLFNSSRIVIAITNFTMERISIVVTPARTLLNPEERCSSANLECQVSGARVCIDSMTACDGVPNCGTYDIYDEDRLTCGGTVGLQHNVYLAAFTFLAVLLTMFYTVHYWLKRCVPKVSDAFFIYSNGGENTLYLETIMRSPTDLGDVPKMPCRGNIFEDSANYSNVRNVTNRSNKFMNFIWKLPGFSTLRDKCKTKSKIGNNEFYVENPGPRKIYSFTEFEIQKMIGLNLNDAAVQTGDSLELEHLMNVKQNEGAKISTEKSLDKYSKRRQISQVPEVNTALGLQENISHHYQSQMDELNILNFFRDVRTDSIGSSFIETRPQLKENIKFDISEDETEINNHLYELHGLYSPPGRLKNEIPSQTLSGSVRKHLRFEEEVTNIPSDEYEEDQIERKESHGRRSFSFVSEKIRRALDLNTTVDDNGGSTSAGREQRSFWGGNKKGKKSKKKTYVPLR